MNFIKSIKHSEVEKIKTVDELIDFHIVDTNGIQLRIEFVIGHIIDELFAQLLAILRKETNVPSKYDLFIIRIINQWLISTDSRTKINRPYLTSALEIYKNRKES